jgi:hypothetical protein
MARKTKHRERLIMSDVNNFKNAVKLVALLQLTLEHMDTLKGTKIYKQRIKNQMSTLEKSVELTLSGPVRQLDNTDENLFNRIQDNIDTILDMDTDELSMLKVAVEEIRE